MYTNIVVNQTSLAENPGNEVDVSRFPLWRQIVMSYL